MLSMKQPFEEAKAKLGDKIVDIRSKTLYLHKVIDDISHTPIAHAESILKEVLKKEFFSKYIKVSQELEGCLGHLLLILDTVGSFGIVHSDAETIGNKEESDTNKTGWTESTKSNCPEFRGDDGNKHMAQMVPLTAQGMSKDANLDNLKVKETIVDNIGYNIKADVGDNEASQAKKFKKNGLQEKSTERVTCHLCGKSVRGNYELKVHLACRHTSESKSELKYVCMLCPSDPKRYARGDRLKEHIERIHLNISNKHVCTLCGRGFNRPGRRNKHQMHCKGVDQDVEVIITEDNVLVSSNIESLQHATEDNGVSGITMTNVDEKDISVENVKDSEVRFYTETVYDNSLPKEESKLKVKEEPAEANNVKVYFTTSSSLRNCGSDKSDTTHISENDTLHISEADDIHINSDDSSSRVHIISTAKPSGPIHSSCGDETESHPVHIMSNRNSMVM